MVENGSRGVASAVLRCTFAFCPNAFGKLLMAATAESAAKSMVLKL